MKETGKFSGLFIAMMIAEDLLVLNILYTCVFTMFKSLVDMNLEQCQILLIFVNMGYLISTLAFPIHVDSRNMQIDRVFRNNLIRVMCTMLIAVVCMFLTKISSTISRAFIVMFTMAFFASMCLSNLATRYFMTSMLVRSGKKLRAVILGAGILGQQINDAIRENTFLGINVLGFFDDDPARNRGNLLGNIDKVKSYATTYGVKQIYCTLPAEAHDKITDLMDFAEQHVIQFHIVPSMRTYVETPVVLETIGDMPILSIRKVPLGFAHNAIIKRLFDVVVSGVFMFTLFPVIYVVTAIAIKLSSPGPVFFRQMRTGEGGRNFYCYKFRSMRVNSDADKVQATADDRRKTRVGDFLRRTSIDELPQFINVLSGDMSIVGPRPHMELHTYEYSSLVHKYMVRHFIKPGITGLAQVSGYRGQTSTPRMMEGRIKRDIWYIEHWTLMLDITIIFRTIVQVFRGDKQAF